MSATRTGIAATLVLAAGVALAGCAGVVSTATPAPTQTTAAAGASPLVGSWRMELTKPDLANAGVSDPGLQNENSGRFTWTFAGDGTWTSIQESLDGSLVMNPVFRGTYTVAGGTFVATTSFPEQYADSGLHYAFTIDGAALRLDVLDPPDPIVELIAETHPWVRVP
jgi:hypothetical protein